MVTSLGRPLRLAAAAALVGALAACGGDSPRPPVAVITPEPVRGVIYQQPYEPFNNGDWLSFPVTVSQRGVLDITIDWTAPDTWMYVYFGQQNCSYAELAARACPFLLSSETKDPKPRALYTQTLEPGTYYLVLYNVPRDPRQGIGSDNTESIAIQLGLTVSASGRRSTEVVHLGRPTVVSPPRL